MLRTCVAVILLIFCALPAISAAPRQFWRPSIHAGQQASWTVFRYKVQLLLLSRDKDRKAALSAVVKGADKPYAENPDLAEYLQKELTNYPLFAHLRPHFHFGVVVSHSELAPEFRIGERVWIEAGIPGAYDDGGMTAWPPSSRGIQICCLTPQEPPTVDGQDSSQPGIPCAEGGAINVKATDWGVPELIQPRDVMVFYLPAAQLQLRAHRLGKRFGLTGEVSIIIEECKSTFPTTTTFATCIRDKLLQLSKPKIEAASVMVAAESAMEADRRNNFRALMPRDKYRGLAKLFLPVGGILVERHNFDVFFKGEVEGYMELKIYVCPFWSS